MRFCLPTLALVFLFSCSDDVPLTDAQGDDYMAAELRTAVEQLKALVGLSPTDDTNVVERSRVVFDWINAHALNGGYVPVNATQTVVRIGGYGLPSPAEVDELIAELTLVDERPEALGSLVATPAGPFVAASFSSFSQTYTVGQAPVKAGGGFLIAKHFSANHADYQTSDPAAANYVSISSSNPAVRFEVDDFPVAGMHGGFRAAAGQLVLRVRDTDLNPGDTATVVYGDTSGGGAGLEMPDFNSDQMPFPIYLDLDGSNLWLSLAIQPIVIIGDTATAVEGFAPSIVAPGELFDLSIRAADQFGNQATGDIGDWEVRDQYNALLGTVASGNSAVTSTALSFAAPGVYRLTLQSPDGAIRGGANPILVMENPANRIYWGDTHGHSGFAEGIGSADAYMRFARDEARLDFVTHSEHDLWMDDFEWDTLRRLVKEYTDEGRFVAYLGYEWTINQSQGGHHNVLFRTPDQRQRVPSQFYPVLSRLYQGLREQNSTRDVLIIPHAHQKADYRLSDPEMENMVEIMSGHGTFEWFARMYLSQGHQVGFLAASDDHIGKPGLSIPKSNSIAQKGGLSAIFALEKTTDAVFDALKTLNAYATTGQRIIMDVSVNGTAMGQRANYALSRDIRGRVIGTAPIRSITLYKNDHILHQWNYRQVQGNNLALTFYSESYPYHPSDNPRGWRNWRGSIEVSGAKLASAELLDSHNQSLQRVLQNEDDPNQLNFATMTRGDHSTLLLKFDGPSDNAQIRITLNDAPETGAGPPQLRRHQMIPGQELTLSVQAMQADEVVRALGFDGYKDSISLSRHGIMPLEVSFDLTDSDSPRQGDYYFVQLRQFDEGLAWSSPTWIGGSPPQ